jgi:type VI secretion system secreted protein Hcp
MMTTLDPCRREGDMATNVYLRFEDPAINGCSTAPGHAGDIEVLSWSHDSSHGGVSFSKFPDSASGEIRQFSFRGRQFENATLRCYRSDGNSDSAPVQYLTVAMQHVVVSNYSVSSGPGDLPVENISLEYGLIEYTYIDQKQAAAP